MWKSTGVLGSLKTETGSVSYSKIRHICEMDIQELGLIKTKPRHLAVSCPRRGTANVCNLASAPMEFPFR